MSSSMNAFAHGSSSESSGDENDSFLYPSTDPYAAEFADYNPRKRRRAGRDAKESAALGVFGSESEDEKPGVRWKKQSLRGKRMSFVSKGHSQLDEVEDHEEDEDMETLPGKVEDEDVGMVDASEIGELTGPQGLGFGAKRRRWENQPQTKTHTSSNIDTPLGKGFVPSSAAAPVLRSTAGDQDSNPRIARPSAFSSPNSINQHSARGNQISHSDTSVNAGSFAARIMAKMGYKEGQGLGKEGQGRSGVIEVQLRPHGVGLGAVAEKSKQEKEEEKRQAKLRGETYEDSNEERKKRRRKPKTSGTDSGMSTPRRTVKPKFRTVEELQRAAPGLQIPDAFAPILDMTGRGQKLLTSTSGLLTPTAVSESIEQSESKKVARRAQNDLTAFVEEWKNLEERKAYVEMEIVQQQQEIDDQQLEFDGMKLFAETTQGISQAVKDWQWDPVIEALKIADGLEIAVGHEELSAIAVAAVHPFLRQRTEGWQPLDDPTLNGMAPALQEIRHIIGATTDADSSVGQASGSKRGLYQNRSKPTSPYESMIYKIIFPRIVSAINQSWDVHNPAPLQTFLDAWDGVLPSFVKSHILAESIVAKLNEAVSSWNPRKRRHGELPHIWLFPWLPYLPPHHADPKSSTGLVSDIKRKFRQLIDSWDFHKGVIPGLQQWREVLCPNSSNDHWTPLIMNHVLPSMARFLKNEQNFVVDPNDQAPYMSSLKGIFAWQDILKRRVIGQLMVETVFPMWHDVLHQWLTVVGPNQEIGQWFEWWRDEVFPEAIKALTPIQLEFEKGHEMINQALDLGSKARTHLPAPSQPAHSGVAKPQLPSAPSTPTRSVPEEESTIRHRVEDWCIENDLQFLPEKLTLHAAGPLYRITAAGNGKNGTLVYFKGNNLFAITRKGAGHVDIKIGWEDSDARDALLEMAWYNVK